jgi:hypothetical protein
MYAQLNNFGSFCFLFDLDFKFVNASVRCFVTNFNSLMRFIRKKNRIKCIIYMFLYIYTAKKNWDGTEATDE